MKNEFCLPSSFFDDLVSACWGKQPGVWRRPSAVPYATPEAVLRGLRVLYSQHDLGEARLITPRIFADGRSTGFRLDAHLPAEEESFDAWEERLRDWAAGRELGMVIPEVQSLGDELWTNALGVARELYRRRGMPAGGAHSEIFFGNYRTSFFRVHKDSLETLTFVVRGKKRFLVWPYEVFADRPEVVPGGERTQINLADDFDYSPFRDRAIVLEGGPGDVFFWPASYWHVAEGVDDQFVTTVTVAFFPSASRASGCPFRLATEAISRAAVDGYDSADPAYPRADTADGIRGVVDGVDSTLSRLLEDPAVRRARREFALAWATGGGFRRVPAEGAPPELTLDDEIEVDAENPLLWADVEPEGFPTSVNGLIVTATPKYLPFVAHLNSGGVFRVASLVDTFGRGGDAPEPQEILDALGALGAVRFFTVTPPRVS